MLANPPRRSGLTPSNSASASPAASARTSWPSRAGVARQMSNREARRGNARRRTATGQGRRCQSARSRALAVGRRRTSASAELLDTAA
eukprot:scaffold123290_cov32-Tisochrysis_lutea.AAC.2